MRWPQLTQPKTCAVGLLLGLAGCFDDTGTTGDQGSDTGSSDGASGTTTSDGGDGETSGTTETSGTAGTTGGGTTTTATSDTASTSGTDGTGGTGTGSSTGDTSDTGGDTTSSTNGGTSSTTSTDTTTTDTTTTDTTTTDTTTTDATTTTTSSTTDTTTTTSTTTTGGFTGRRCSETVTTQIEDCVNGSCTTIDCPGGFICLDGYFCQLPTDIVVNGTSTNFQHHMSVGSVATTGEWVAVLQQLSPDATYLRRFDEDGVAQGSDFLLQSGNYKFAEVTGFTDGRIAAVNSASVLTTFDDSDTLLKQATVGDLGGVGVTDGFAIATLGTSMFVAAGDKNAQRYSVDGTGTVTAVGSAISTGGETHPNVFAFANGRWVLQLGGDSVQRYDSSGNTVGSQEGSGTGTGYESGGRALTNAGNNNDVFVVAYGGDFGEVYVKAYPWTGSPGIAVDAVDPDLAAAAQEINVQDVARLSDGNVLVIYQQYVTYDDRRVIVQRLTRTGTTLTKAGDALRIPRPSANAQRRNIRAAQVGANRIVIIWILKTNSVFYESRAQILHYVE